MVSLLLGKRADAIREIERLAKVLEPELLLEVMVVDDAPVGPQLLSKARELFPFQRRNASATRDAFSICQIAQPILLTRSASCSGSTRILNAFFPATKTTGTSSL